MSTFHGGNTSGWGPVNDSYIWIDDIEISSNPLPFDKPGTQNQELFVTCSENMVLRPNPRSAMATSAKQFRVAERTRTCP